ncbi:MAG: DUF1304 domain-containing protein [Deltaproteobacteria bacterium]|nr:DUF1304 domain-containing protein [Deltaproteobacteria bacterium]
MFAKLSVVGVSVLHFGFMALESFLWTGPTGKKVFGHSLEHAQQTKVLAMNQGAYNGLLAATLLWALFTGRWETCAALLVFIIAAGLVGGLTAAKSILVLQMLPALIALGAVISVISQKPS